MKKILGKHNENTLKTRWKQCKNMLKIFNLKNNIKYEKIIWKQCEKNIMKTLWNENNMKTIWKQYENTMKVTWNQYENNMKTTWK